MKISIDDLTITSAELPEAIPARKYPTQIIATPARAVKLPVFCNHCFAREVERSGETCKTCLSLDLSHWRRFGKPVLVA